MALRRLPRHVKGTGSQRTWNRRRTFATRRKSVFGKEKQAQTKQDTSMSPFGRVMTARLARILAEELGEEAPSDPDFNSVVIFSQRLMRSGRGQARQSGRRALRRLLGDFLPQMFKTATSVLSKEVIADAFATATPMVAEWLVGRSEKVSGIAQPKGGTAEVDGEIRERPDEPAVLIPKCRILDESGCMGVCANVCKVPTQEFFAEMGVELWMEPDPETRSCCLRFGRAPPLPEHDPSLQTPCLGDCPVARSNNDPCAE